MREYAVVWSRGTGSGTVDQQFLPGLGALTSEPRQGTIAPNMGTNPPTSLLSSALFGKTRRAVLGLLFNHPDRSFYLREVVRLAGVGQGAAQRELERLVEAGIIRRLARGRQVYFRANDESPIFAELRGIILKTAGLADVLRQALSPLRDRVHLAFVYGSLARGEDRSGSDVDICVVGEVTFAEVVAAIGPSQDQLAREINPTVYPPAEFGRKLATGHHFLTSVAKSPKMFLIGDEGEFARMEKKWMAGSSSDRSPGDR